MTRGALAETGLCRRPDGEEPLPERLSPSLGMKSEKQLKTREKRNNKIFIFPVSYPSPSLPIPGLYMFNELASCLSVFLSPLLHAIPSPPCPHWLFLLASPFLLRPMFFPLALTMLRERTEGKKRKKKKDQVAMFFFVGFFLITEVFHIHCPPYSVPEV